MLEKKDWTRAQWAVFPKLGIAGGSKDRPKVNFVVRGVS